MSERAAASAYDEIPQQRDGAAGPSPAVQVAKVLVGFFRFVFEDSLQAFCQGVYLCKKWKLVSFRTQMFTMASISVGIFLSLIGPLKEYLGLKNFSLAAATEEVNDAPYEPGADFNQFEHKAGPNKLKHGILKLMSVLFWGGCIAYPFVLDDQLTCDGDNPDVAVQAFVFFVIVDLILQYMMVFTRGIGCLRLLEGTAFTCLARFDTFADVAFTAKLVQCDEITWFSMKGFVFNFPFGLSLVNIALFALIFGVFIMQALPGIVLIAYKVTPLSLKFNDFNVLLAAES
jgi:hypothetical protein